MSTIKMKKLSLVIFVCTMLLVLNGCTSKPKPITSDPLPSIDTGSMQIAPGTM